MPSFFAADDTGPCKEALEDYYWNREQKQPGSKTSPGTGALLAPLPLRLIFLILVVHRRRRVALLLLRLPFHALVRRLVNLLLGRLLPVHLLLLIEVQFVGKSCRGEERRQENESFHG